MTKVRAQVNEETNKGQLPWGHTNLIGAVYLNGAPAPGAVAAAAPLGRGRCRSRLRRRARVLALDQGLQQGRRAQRLSDQLSERPVPVAGAGRGSPRWRAAPTGQRDPQPHAPASIPPTFTEEANQTTEDQIGLDKGQRRDVQRRLNRARLRHQGRPACSIQSTRAVITRWQAARGYPKSGYLNKLQHKALLTEIVAAAPTAASERGRAEAPTSASRLSPRCSSAGAAARPAAACARPRSRRRRPLHRRRHGRRHAGRGFRR